MGKTKTMILFLPGPSSKCASHYTHACMCTHMSTHTYAHMHTHKHICTYAYTCIHMHIHACTHTHAHTQAHILIHAHTHAHAHYLLLLQSSTRNGVNTFHKDTRGRTSPSKTVHSSHFLSLCSNTGLEAADPRTSLFQHTI